MTRQASLSALILCAFACTSPSSPPAEDAGTGTDAGSSGTDAGSSGTDAGESGPLLCDDHLRNGTEADVDCSGGCPACGADAACTQDGDCFSQKCVNAKCAPVEANASSSLQQGIEGRRYAFACPPNVLPTTIWGTDVYTADSAICTAAVHSGLITSDAGGVVIVVRKGARDHYSGTDRHGVRSNSYGSYPASYVFEPIGPCANGVKDTGELDVDCGGGCGACGLGQSCSDAEGCVSRTCEAGRCVKAPCENEVKDGTESDVDCGGDECRLCPVGKACGDGDDCDSDTCVDGACVQRPCQNGVKDGAETDVDCGGGTCSPCQSPLACLEARDCASGACVEQACVVPTCSDGTRNGHETDVDCGGNACRPCAQGQACGFDGDCTSLSCSGTCQAPGACANGVKDTGEIDVDCGGACGPCAAGKACAQPGDCLGDLCTSGRCGVPPASLSRQVAWGRSIGRRYTFHCDAPVSVGGLWGTDVYTDDSSVCGIGVHAGVFALDAGGDVTVEGQRGRAGYRGSTRNGVTSSDYGPWLSSIAVVPLGACANGVKDGAETDVDCGGTCGGCGLGAVCVVDADCSTPGCVGGHCAR